MSDGLFFFLMFKWVFDTVSTVLIVVLLSR